MHFFSSSNPTIVTHCHLSLPKRMIWGTLCLLDLLNVLVGREGVNQDKTSKEVQDIGKTPGLMSAGCSPFLGTFQRLE